MRDLFDDEILDSEAHVEKDRIRRRYSFRVVSQYGSSYESEGSRAFDPSELSERDFSSWWRNQ